MNLFQKQLILGNGKSMAELPYAHRFGPPLPPLRISIEDFERAEMKTATHPTTDPLPRCKHNNCLQDGSGELLEPPCGCRLPAPQETPAQQELSPCPFCGQSPTVGLLDEDGGVHLDRIIAECKECGFYLSVIDKDCDNLLTLKPQLIAKWNTRYRDPAFQKLEASLEAITQIAGNLTDEAVEAVGGINDARSRALMVVNARRIAREALRLAREERE